MRLRGSSRRPTRPPTTARTTDIPTFRLLALDVDGTLTQPTGTIDPELLAAINAVAALGVAVVLATGRGRPAMRLLMRQLHPSGHVVLNNGGVVRQAGSQRVLRACHLDLDSSRESLRELRRHGMLAIWVESPYAGDRYLVDGDWWNHPASATYLRPKAGAVRPLPDPVCAAPPVEIFAFGARDEVAAAEAGLRASLGARISTVSWWSDRLQSAAVEVLPAGVTKGASVAWLARELDIKSSAAVAVGDDRNDIEMLRWAGRGIAIAGAPDDVVAAANEVLANHGEGAVRRLIRQVWGI